MAHPPRPGQLETLQRLCELAGERYSRPRTSAQATGRIRDLQVRLGGSVAKVPSAPRHRREPDDLLRALRALKRECYGQARPERIAQLEARVDRLMGAPVE